MCGRRIADRGGRLDPLARWAKGFAYELDTDHRVVDDILCRWTTVARRLADPAVPFASAKEEAVDVAVGLRDLLQRHLEVEDRDILPLYWRHYTAAEFDVVYHQAIKGGKKKGISFVVPWNVYCLDPQRRTTLVGLAPFPSSSCGEQPGAASADSKGRRSERSRSTSATSNPSGRRDHAGPSSNKEHPRSSDVHRAPGAGMVSRYCLGVATSDPVPVLAGLKVVDLCDDRAGSVAGMLLADLGADVVRVETSGGDHRRPAPSQLPDAVSWDRRKRTQVVERLDPNGDVELRELLASADVMLVDGSAGLVRGSTFDPQALSERWPALVVVWLPAYGDRGGAYGELPADPLLLSAVSAYAMFQPAADPTVPIAPVVPVVEIVQGALGAAAALAGVLERRRGGAGQVVSLSGLDAASALLATLVNEGLDVEQVFRPSRDALGGPHFRPYACGDGEWLFLAALSPTLFLAALDVLDAMDVMVMEGVDGEFLNLFGPVTGPRAAQMVEARFAEHPRQHWLERLAAAGVPAEPVQTRGEWVASNAFATLGGFDTFRHPVVGEVHTPANPLRFTLPKGGERAEPGGGWLRRPVGVGRRGPLAGLRVIDLATFLAAPFAATLLGFWGAEVVKVETPDGDPYRVYTLAYLAVNQGKRSAVFDLHSTEGRRRFEQLVAGADVLVDNLRPSSRTSLSMETESIRALNPLVVHATVTAFGEEGDWSERPGFDPSIQALSGLMVASGEPGRPVSTTTAIHDVGSGALLAVGVLAALWRQAGDGTVPRVTTSLAGTASLLQCAELTEFAGRPPSPRGGVDFVGQAAGYRYYAASDGWIGLAARADAELRRAIDVLGATASDVLDGEPHGVTAAAIEEAICDRSVADVLELLRQAGVPAAPVIDAWGTDEHLLANDFAHVVRDPQFGRCRVMRGYGHWSRSAEAVPEAMPAQGADTAEFASGWPG